MVDQYVTGMVWRLENMTDADRRASDAVTALWFVGAAAPRRWLGPARRWAVRRSRRRHAWQGCGVG